MKPDPILEEVWQSEDDLARETGYDIHEPCENTSKWMAEHPHPDPVLHRPEDLRRPLTNEEGRKRNERAGIAMRAQDPGKAGKPDP
jgi:hypothetical protein